MEKEIELNIKQVFESQTKPGIFGVILEEKGVHNRQIPLVIGEKEAHAIYCAINKITPTRPLTHDLMVSCCDFAHIEILKVLVYKMDVGIYYSYIYIKHEDEFTRIDARTSDALALALRTDAPVYILEELLERECVEQVTKKDDLFALTKELEDEQAQLDIDKNKLKKQLKDAIEKEDYELASILRDRIAELD